MSNLFVCPVTADDRETWLALWQAYLRFYQTDLAPAVSDVTWQRLLDPNEPCHSALAWREGQAVGMVNYIYHRSNWSVSNACYLQDVFVTPDRRGTGLGRALIEYVYASATADGCDKVHWLTHETNATAIQLYERIADRSGFIQFRKVF
jgi:GNAT superfamily N-acetyltransferase